MSRFGAIVSALLLAGCASALRDPGTLHTAPSGEPTASAEALLAEADELFGRQQLDPVRRAAELSLEAARVDPESIDGLVGAVRARAWLADHLESPDARREAAAEAVRAGQWCEERAPEDPACAYWLAVGLGVQARERRSTALDGLDRMVERLKRALEQAPELDRAGPDRVLALVYLRAPGWPSGPGDPDAGLAHARAAVERDPGFPPNRLCLAEALLEAGEDGEARRVLETALRDAEGMAAAGRAEGREWAAEATRRLEALGPAG